MLAQWDRNIPWCNHLAKLLEVSPKVKHVILKNPRPVPIQETWRQVSFIRLVLGCLYQLYHRQNSGFKINRPLTAGIHLKKPKKEGKNQGVHSTSPIHKSTNKCRLQWLKKKKNQWFHLSEWVGSNRKELSGETSCRWRWATDTQDMHYQKQTNNPQRLPPVHTWDLCV